MLGRVKRAGLAWGVIGLLVVAGAAMYWLNPFHTASDDPRARILGVTVYRMQASDMEPTLHLNSYFLVSSLKLAARDPRIGEIVAFRFPPNPDVHYIKRVIATGGSLVEMRGGRVYLDGKPLAEPWLPTHPQTEMAFDGRPIRLRPEDIFADFPPTPVPARHFFVLGDNRGNSSDSREWGFVPRENLIGIYAPLY
jgi:signal peptidase I